MPGGGGSSSGRCPTNEKLTVHDVVLVCLLCTAGPLLWHKCRILPVVEAVSDCVPFSNAFGNPAVQLPTHGIQCSACGIQGLANDMHGPYSLSTQYGVRGDIACCVCTINVIF